MKYPMFLPDEYIKLLEFEVLSQDFYIRLTRELLAKVEELEESSLIIAQKNRLINRANTIKGEKIYILESDSYGSYEQAEYDWHDGSFLLIFRKLSTIEFIEFAIQLLEMRQFKVDDMNSLLEKESASFRFIPFHTGYNIEIYTIDEIEKDIEQDKEDINSHPNVRVLINRMETSYNNEDYSGVLHASASIFETMAKDIIGISSIQDQTLKSFFERYRIDTNIPEEVLDYILKVYEDRNVSPLAGHGSTQAPSINKENATALKELTKAFVRIEYQIRKFRFD